MSDIKPRVLIIHALRPTSRQTTIDHLLAFREHLPNADVQYLHFAQPLPKDLADGVAPDLLIVNYDYLNYRFTPLWPYIKNRHRGIARRARNVVAIPQDDFWCHRLLDDWCVSWGVKRILTPIDNDLEVLYPKSSKRAEFKTVLTGYAPAKALGTVALPERPIDLGQRVRMMPPHLGSYAQQKAEQSLHLAAAARRAGFVVDVSTRTEDGFVGSAWPEFLAQCKFTVGMKGGASIADPYGLLYSRVEAYKHRHSGRELTSQSFGFLRRRDNRHRFSAISPRLFEAAAAGTCQILRLDDYLGVLEPWTHYIPLHDDYSNMDEVIRAMVDIESASQIAKHAQEALIDSGNFGYSHLVMAAVEGFSYAVKSTGVSGWQALKDWLEASARLSTPTTQALCDATFHLIYESLRQPNRSIAADTVVNQLHRASAAEWSQLMSDVTATDKLSWRMPWIPRLLPIS